jgi:hypothetical protein
MKKHSGTYYFLITVLGLCLLAFPPFIATLELHHQLGAADNDGHQHSSADLCSWVQSHASSSLATFLVILLSQPAEPASETTYQDRLVQHLIPTDLPARGPPSPLL